METGSPERRLESLGRELEKGKVVLTIEAPTRSCRERAELTLRELGGRMIRRSLA